MQKEENWDENWYGKLIDNSIYNSEGYWMNRLLTVSCFNAVYDRILFLWI